MVLGARYSVLSRSLADGARIAVAPAGRMGVTSRREFALAVSIGPGIPRPPLVPVGLLRQLLAELPEDWRVSADDVHRLVLVDDQLTPRGYIDLDAGRVVRLPGDPEES